MATLTPQVVGYVDGVQHGPGGRVVSAHGWAASKVPSAVRPLRVRNGESVTDVILVHRPDIKGQFGGRPDASLIGWEVQFEGAGKPAGTSVLEMNIDGYWNRVFEF